MHRNAFITAAIAASFTIGSAVAGERLSGDELQQVLVGNTTTGVYPDEGQEVEFWEYFKKGGKIRGKDVKYGKYAGKYEIRDDGCLHNDYEGDAWDGCYYLERESGNSYAVTRPYADEKGRWTILEGDPQKLDRGY